MREVARHSVLNCRSEPRQSPMLDSAQTVHVVDDDPDVRTAIEFLLEARGLKVTTYESAAQFLKSYDPAAPGCIVLDLALPEMSGIELQRALEARCSVLPIIFLTGRGDIATSVHAMKHGAADFLTKPVEDGALVAAVFQALVRNNELRAMRAERDRITERMARLTAREREVLELIAAGRLNKQIAADLGTVENTVKFHRANLMRKLDVNTFADLVKMVERAADFKKPAP
ncbi:MAG: response regulator [Betaproteobacteria bacterium]